MLSPGGMTKVTTSSDPLISIPRVKDGGPFIPMEALDQHIQQSSFPVTQ